MIKKIFNLYLVVLIVLNLGILVFPITANAEVNWPKEPDINCPTGVVMELETGTVLFKKDELTAYAPASITKIMTALIAIENSSLDEIVVFSEDAINGIELGSSSISRDFNEEMTMEECLYGLMLESANECANAIAEHVSGDIKSFVDLMNKKAKEIGCQNTHFANPHGLYEKDHYTCAYDMSLIARQAYLNPTFALITGTKGYTIPPTNKHKDPTPLNNHHAMLNYYQTNKYIYDYCVGGKTGYTQDAGNTLVTYAKKDDVVLICVVMKSSSPNHYTETKKLFEYYFDQIELYSAGDYISQLSDTQEELTVLVDDIDPLEIDDGGKILLPKGCDFNELETEFVPGRNKSSGIGQVVFNYNGHMVGYADVLGKKNNNTMYPFHNISEKDGGSKVQFVQINLIKIAIIVVAVIVLVILIVLAIKKYIEISIHLRRNYNAKKKNKIDLPRIKRNNRRRR